MSDADLVTIFVIGLVVAAVVVLVAAALLIAIILTARSIRGHAAEALEAAEQIADDVQVIWALDETNRLAGEILMGAESIERHGGEIVDALHSTNVLQER